MIILTVLMGLNSKEAMAFERSEAFIVKVFHQKVKVLSPAVMKKMQAIIVENKTLVKLIGKVENHRGKILGFVSIAPGKFQSLEFKMNKGIKYFFIPMAPASQEIELLIGKKSYEIPPKK
ncbi:MAG: hypothetical protein HOM21_13530 [Halobacteriovoraceae bacterium]|nr:hypothetical protein [Halobacteriovoraceae bacterium]